MTMRAQQLPGYDFSSYEEFESDYSKLTLKERREWVVNMPAEKLSLASGEGISITVAHALAIDDNLPEKFLSFPVLSLSVPGGISVAHVLAMFGLMPEKFFRDEKVLSISDAEGFSVAHMLVSRNLFPPELLTRRILFQEDNNGTTVADVLFDSLSAYISDPSFHKGILETLGGNGTPETKATLFLSLMGNDSLAAVVGAIRKAQTQTMRRTRPDFIPLAGIILSITGKRAEAAAKEAAAKVLRDNRTERMCR